MTNRLLPLALLLICTLVPLSLAQDAPNTEAVKAKIPGLKLWYKLDDADGKTAKNAVEKGVALELVGATWAKDGKFGGALSFDGDSNYAITAAAVQGDFADGHVTIAAWIFPKAGGVVVDELGAHELEGSWHDSQIEVLDDGEVKVRVWSLDSVSLGKLKLNEWHHVVVRYDAKAQTLDGFLDGVKSTDKVNGTKEWNSGNDIYYAFGAKDSTNLGHGGFFKGLIDDIRVYNRPLTDDEVKTLAAPK